MIDLGTETIDYVMDCGTNGRGFFTALPSQGWQFPAGFLPWQWGAMGMASWTGVPPEHAMPMADALQQKTLLVFQMNGEPLPVDHGYPLRFFVPGFGANANVKWLGRLTITTAQPDFSPTQKNEIIVGPDYPAQGLTPALQNPKSCFELFAPRATRARDRERRLGAIPLAGTIVQRVVAGTVRKRTETQLVGALLLQLAGSRTGLLPDRQPRVRRARTSAAAGRHVPSPGSRPTGPSEAIQKDGKGCRC